jgi:uncharacterized membrane protein
MEGNMNTGKTAGLLLGVAFGASIMFLIDPQAGRRRRARVTQKIRRFGNVTEEAFGTTSRDVANRTRGLFAQIASWFRREPVDDLVLAERVRARLGFLVDHPSSIGVVANDGRITLSGPVLAHEVERLLDEVHRIPGVTRVDNHLDVHEEPGDVSGLQGGPSQRRRGAQFEFWQEHWSPTARLVASGIGAGLLVSTARLRPVPGALVATVGLGLLARAITNLDLQRLTGIGAGRRAVEVNKTIRIAAPVHQVFEFWTKFEQYPQFMETVREVRITGEGRSHWVLEGPGGIPIEWNLRVVCHEPPTKLAWKTEPDSAVQHTGLVLFKANDEGGTTVHIQMSYNPVAGALGDSAAALVGYDLKSVLDEEVMRMKTAIETGKLPERRRVGIRTVSQRSGGTTEQEHKL